MEFKDLFKRPVKAATQTKTVSSDIILKIAQEFQDRSRKDIQKWRQAITAAENPENPRWYLMQDLIDDVMIDAHLSSVIGIRKSATLNHRFYVLDKNENKKLDEQTDLLTKRWFYDFIDVALDAISRKYTLLQFFREGDTVKFDIIPRRNVCPQLKRIYMEVGADNFIDYSAYPNVIEVVHNSKFGLINDVAANVIWKRNLMQSNAEFSERFGMPLITATTSNKADAARIDNALKNLGEAGTGVLPNGTEIKVHALANAGNPEKVYLEPATFHDNQVSKRFLGSTTITDEGANRNQTQVHIETLDDKLALDDKRLIMFTVNDMLFPVLQSFGFPFDNTKMAFQFDETEDLTLTEQWSMTNEALAHYELDENEIQKTFNLPIKSKKTRDSNPLQGGFSANFR
jgi:phage gp29-like protein